MIYYENVSYPLIFVHGMFGWGENEGINKVLPYWGSTTGDITKYLLHNGIECYAASVGPMSSAWDQACELYAQLKGTRVDYGEYHSSMNSHKRFGRTYTKPLFDNWSSDKKVHLIGHSFGGNAIRLLAHLLKYGSPDEVRISGDDCSPLFIGGQENLISSVSTICSPLNGTDAYETANRYKLINPIKFISYNYACLLSRTKLHGRLIDFHLEQFGINDTPNKNDKNKFITSMKILFNNKDSIVFDMSENGSQKMNNIIKTVPSIYYFSYSYNSVVKNLFGRLKPYFIDFGLLRLTSYLMLKNGNKLKRYVTGNDGLVDVPSSLYPKNEKYKHFIENDKLEVGMWNVMPLRKGDHGTPIGLFADKSVTREFYNDIITILSFVEKRQKSEERI